VFHPGATGSPYFLDKNHGLLYPTGSFQDDLLSLVGPRGILNRAIVAYQPNTTKIVDCCNIRLVFSVPVTAECALGGNAIFLNDDIASNGTQFYWSGFPTGAPIYANNSIWELHENPIAGSNCQSAGNLFNPVISTDPSYDIAELWSNHGNIGASGSFVDTNIDLYGDNSIISKSIVIGNASTTASSCCTITPTYSRINGYQLAPRYNVDAVLAALNQYRVENGYPPIPISVALMTTGQWHANMILQYPETITSTCGSFSWPGPPIADLWQPCCYLVAEGTSSMCVRYKPLEITSNWKYPFGYGIFFSTVKISQEVEYPESVIADAWLNDPIVKRCLLESECMGKVWLAIGLGIASDQTSQVRAYLYLSTTYDETPYTPYTTNTTLPDYDLAALAYTTVEDPSNPISAITNMLILAFSILAVVILIIIVILLVLICRDRAELSTEYTEMNSID